MTSDPEGMLYTEKQWWQWCILGPIGHACARCVLVLSAEAGALLTFVRDNGGDTTCHYQLWHECFGSKRQPV